VTKTEKITIIAEKRVLIKNKQNSKALWPCESGTKRSDHIL